MKIFGIGIASFFDLIRQPIYWVIIACGSILLLGSRWLTLFGFGREQQILRESGVAGPVLAGLVIIFLSIPGTIGEEIRTRQILTILSKPISGLGLIWGKFLGLCMALAVAFLIFGGFFSLTLYMSEGHVPFFALTGAYFLGFLQVCTMGAVTLMFSVMLPVPATVIASFIVFMMGNLIPFLSKQIEQMSTLWRSLADFALLCFPDLIRLNASFDFAMGRTASSVYLSFAALYAAVYVSFLIFIAGAYLSHRELA